MANMPLSAGTPARNPTLPAESNQDAPILAAFARWKDLHAKRAALPPEGHANQEFALWDRIDLLDKQVHDLPATTPAGIACKLWVAITHNTTEHDPEAAAFRTDLDWFVYQGGAIDWNVRCIVSALVALKTMEG